MSKVQGQGIVPTASQTYTKSAADYYLSGRFCLSLRNLAQKMLGNLLAESRSKDTRVVGRQREDGLSHHDR